jgi:hypothetical protein
MRRLCVALVLGAGIGGCGGSGAANTYTPGPWSASQQGDFLGGCSNDVNADVSDAYCHCALVQAMKLYPDPSKLPGSPETGGMTAAEHKSDFSQCTGK